MPNANEKRQKLQDLAFDTLMDKDRLILNWGTGVGKSRPAVRAMKTTADENPDAKILLMVQETPHKENWRNEMVAAYGEQETKRILAATTIDCYASLKKHKNSSWDLIVFDEGHHLRSPLRQSIVLTMKATRVLLLSATVSDANDGDMMLVTLEHAFGKFETMSFGIREAIREKILGEPEIHIIPVVLDDDRRETYEDLTRRLKEKKDDYFREKNRLGLGDGKETPETEELRQKWLYLGGRRKQMLGHSKTTIARKILREKLAKSRFVCFCASLKQIEWLGGSNTAVNSKCTEKENMETIHAFNEGKTSSLFAMGMLQEGQNLKGIESGLIIQLDSKTRPFVQKFGRVMRASSPVLYILYVMGTQDEEYLKKALAGIDKRFVKFSDPVLPDGSTPPGCINWKDIQENLMAEKKALDVKLPQFSAIWSIEQKNAEFVSNKGDTSKALRGYVREITKEDSAGPMLRITLLDTQGGFVQEIILHRKLAFSLLAPLVAAKKLYSRPITISLKEGNKGFADYEVLFGADRLRWSNSEMANYRNARNKLEYIDELIDRINEAIVPDKN